MNERIEQAYWNGFAIKCAEVGVDPVKVARMTGDYLRATPQALALGSNPVTAPLNVALSTGAGLAGLASGAVDKKEKQRLVDGKAAWLPGGAAWNFARRARGVAGESEADGADKSKSNLWSEEFGSIPAALAAAGLGAGVGLGVGGSADSAGVGAAAGLGASAAAVVAAMLLAGARQRRTRQAQTEHDDSGVNTAANLLVPGAAIYNRLKRLGRSRDWDDDNQRRKLIEQQAAD